MIEGQYRTMAEVRWGHTQTCRQCLTMFRMENTILDRGTIWTIQHWAEGEMGAAEDATFNNDNITGHFSKSSLLIIQTWSNLAYMSGHMGTAGVR